MARCSRWAAAISRTAASASGIGAAGRDLLHEGQVVEGLHDLLAVAVGLAALAHAEEPGRGEVPLGGIGREGVGVAAQDVLGQVAPSPVRRPPTACR